VDRGGEAEAEVGEVGAVGVAEADTEDGHRSRYDSLEGGSIRAIVLVISAHLNEYTSQE
jgi:hypothetical protein